MKNHTTRTCKLSILLLSFVIFFNSAKAQYVTLPDADFVSWLNINGFLDCLNGNQLDTTCASVLNATTLNCYGVPIHDLTGIQYFKNLNTLDCSNDSIYTIPAFPPNLTYINCDFNNLSTLPALPNTLVHLECSNYNSPHPLTSLPNLPNSVSYLDCTGNSISSLSALPTSLVTFYCSSNQFSGFPSFPTSLRDFNGNANLLTSLPALPASLNQLNCAGNLLSSLPALPALLSNLSCSENQITVLPALPPSLNSLSCSDNPITSLPSVLPNTLENLFCYSNSIGLLTSLPPLPASLKQLACQGNQLTSIPALPASLTNFACSKNRITSLPAFPNSLTSIECDYNLLTALPALPDTLTFLNCRCNPDLNCLPQLKKINTLYFDSAGITCLPNYGTVLSSVPELNTLPLCGIFNSGGCQPYWNISGEVYYDNNTDCYFDGTDVGQGYVKIKLTSGGMQQQVYSSANGGYSFTGNRNINYTIQPDTTNLPFVVSCPNTGYLNALITAADSLSYDNNFALHCRTEGVDVGVQSVINNYIVPRPATGFTLNTWAGDMSAFYGAHCAAGASGQVQLIYSGEVAYHGIANGALNPASVSNGIVTWDVADFGTVNDYSAFNTLFTIDSNATPGTQVCFTVHVTTTANDYNPANNTGYFCLTIVNALDPNEKEVSPAGNIDTAQQWLTYTVRFQNTGSAPALNIRVTDTLDNNLEPSTFQLTAFSAKNMTQVFGNAVVFNFPNINLPDSLTSDSASRGYVQYKVKLKNNLPLGTQIKNTADIYFDLNPAVVTNTATSTISNTTDIKPVSSDNGALNISLYPNPAKDYAILETDATAIGATLQISDVTGKEVMKLQVSSIKTQIPISALADGLYVVKLSDTQGRSGVKKLVVE